MQGAEGRNIPQALDATATFMPRTCWIHHIREMHLAGATRVLDFADGRLGGGIGSGSPARSRLARVLHGLIRCSIECQCASRDPEEREGKEARGAASGGSTIDQKNTYDQPASGDAARRSTRGYRSPRSAKLNVAPPDVMM